MGRHSRPGAGRLHQPTDDQRRQVLMMVGFGLRQDEVCISLQIDKKTLHKHYRRELDTGMIEANVRVAQALYANATKHNNVAAQIWWTKTRMGWKDTSVVENKGDLVIDFRWADAPTPTPVQKLGAVADETTAPAEITDVTWSDISEC